MLKGEWNVARSPEEPGWYVTDKLIPMVEDTSRVVPMQEPVYRLYRFWNGFAWSEPAVKSMNEKQAGFWGARIDKDIRDGLSKVRWRPVSIFSK